VVTLRQVRKRYGRGPWVLDGVELELPPGRTTVLLGANGSGKSTLLRIAAGASVPTSGSVAGRPAAVGYAPEHWAGPPRMAAGSYLRHMARLRGASPSRVDSLVHRLGLLPGPGAPLGTLSKGNRQKVALAQAFLAPAGLLVLDEPYGGLDERAAAALTALLAESRSAGVAVLVSAHSLDRHAGADLVRELASGQLREPAGAPAMRLLLAPRHGADLAPVAAVAAVVWDEVGGRLRVRTDDADRVLRVALDAGWSLRHAEQCWDEPC
jgi:ABC-2 type transport system ATP-binding protein